MTVAIGNLAQPNPFMNWVGPAASSLLSPVSALCPYHIFIFHPYFFFPSDSISYNQLVL